MLKINYTVHNIIVLSGLQNNCFKKECLQNYSTNKFVFEVDK